MAAASVGVMGPIEHAPSGNRVFAETREEIDDLPWKGGCGTVSGRERGLIFCATVGQRAHLRFVRA